MEIPTIARRALQLLAVLALLASGAVAVADRIVNAHEPILVSDDIGNRTTTVISAVDDLSTADLLAGNMVGGEE